VPGLAGGRKRARPGAALLALLGAFTVAGHLA
jgi:hypothetical protein